jgi:hypothetical protein
VTNAHIGIVGLLLLIGCSPANTGTWTHPTTGRAAPSVAFPLDEATVLAKRVRLTTPGFTLLHNVAVDSPGGTRIMMGRMRFADHDSYTLVASAAIGMRLFTLGFTPKTGVQVDVAGPLKGRFPADRLARDIQHIYVSACVGPDTTVSQFGGGYSLKCTVSEKTQVSEIIRGSTMEVTQRVIVESGGRTLTVDYENYGWWGGHWHPKTIKLRSDKARVTIVLSGFEPDSEEPKPHFVMP